MTREELDFIGALNMCDEISNEAYKKIMCHCEEQEPCEDCIDRADAMTEIMMFAGNKKHDDDIYVKVSDAVQLLRELPSVQPKPKTGHWIPKTPYVAICSVCNYLQSTNGADLTGKALIHKALFKYCHNCGAKMEEEKIEKIPMYPSDSWRCNK